MESSYKRGSVVFGSWTITKSLGEGSFGKVYEIEREDFGTKYKSALKIITVPRNQNDLDNILDDGMSMEDAKAYFSNFVQEIVNEFVIMSKLKGESHVVNYEDHMVVKHDNDIGWDILIKMELLTPLTTYLRSHSLTNNDVIKLGMDICDALTLCHNYNIIHRDIKPLNIFISENGNYKLGDFGIARMEEVSDYAMSKKGTHTYMAPEVYKSETYTDNVDTYSLGLVMYKLLNNNHNPFCDATTVTYSDKENALALRIKGELLPEPDHASEALADIILKACSYNPADRYVSAAVMGQALQSIYNTQNDVTVLVPLFEKDDDYGETPEDDTDCKTEYVPLNSPSIAQSREDLNVEGNNLSKQFSKKLNLNIPKDKRKMLLGFITSVLIVALLSLLLFISNKPATQKDKSSESGAAGTTGDVLNSGNLANLSPEMIAKIQSGEVDTSALSPEIIAQINSGNFDASGLSAEEISSMSSNGLNLSSLPPEIAQKIQSGELDVSSLSPEVVAKINSGEINASNLPADVKQQIISSNTEKSSTPSVSELVDAANSTSTSIANAIKERIEEKENYVITVKSNNSNYGKVYGGGTYREGRVAFIKATAKSGYTFVKWNDGDTDKLRAVTVKENATYTAIFEKK